MHGHGNTDAGSRLVRSVHVQTFFIELIFVFLRYKNGQEIQPGARYSVFSDQSGNYSLVISDALPQDSGSYEITVRNQYGTANSKTNLQILGKFFNRSIERVIV